MSSFSKLLFGILVWVLFGIFDVRRPLFFLEFRKPLLPSSNFLLEVSNGLFVHYVRSRIVRTQLQLGLRCSALLFEVLDRTADTLGRLSLLIFRSQSFVRGDKLRARLRGRLIELVGVVETWDTLWIRSCPSSAPWLSLSESSVEGSDARANSEGYSSDA